MHFGENELSPGAIGFSPLPSPHGTVLQHRPLRASSRFYPAFTQGKGRSLGFASAPRDFTPYSDSLSLRLRTKSA